MAKISSYTTVTAAAGDKVIGTDVAGTPADGTKNFLVEDIAGLATLTQVLTAGNTADNLNIVLTGTGSLNAVNSTLSGTLGVTGESTFSGNVVLSSTLTAGGVGTAGQVLASQGAGLPPQWVTTQASSTAGISSAQILSLFTTPVTLVAGVAGKHIVPLKIVASYTHNTTPYTIGASNYAVVTLGTYSVPANVAMEFSGDLLTTASSGVYLNNIESVVADRMPQYATNGGGDALLLQWRTTNPTLGDGTLSVTTIYTLVDA